MLRGSAGKPKLVLATDLDGTLVGCRSSQARFNRIIGARRPELLLVYITGRTLASSLQLIRTENLLGPDVLITDVGTEIHTGPRFICNAGWEMKMAACWNRERIEAAFAPLEELVPQDIAANYRLAYIARPGSLEGTLSRMNRLKEALRLPIEIVSSLERIVDVVPAGAGKGPALAFVQRQMGLQPNQIIVCGDSGNDYSMFIQGFRGIVVGNACPAFRRMLKDDKDAYRSPYPHAAGIIDGLNRFGVLP